jgi:predicted acyl esterase
MSSRRKRVREDLPHEVREVEHAWIPLAGGARLAARIWLPEGVGPAPAIVEYLPYRKRDRTRWRDEPMHRWFAGHGLAVRSLAARQDALRVHAAAQQVGLDGLGSL